MYIFYYIFIGNLSSNFEMVVKFYSNIFDKNDCKEFVKFV